MGHKDIERAYKLSLPAPQKAVLLALAHCRNGKTGKCFPSQQELCNMTGLSEATVRRSLGVLETSGVIVREKNFKSGYRTNDSYILNTDYQTERPPVTVTTGQPDRQSESPRPPVTVTETTGHSDGAVEQTGIQPEVNRKLAAQRGSRIPKDFTVTPAMVAWAREHTPLVDGPRATEKFIDHWTAATGRNATKRDWTATWRNWLRTDQERAESNPGRKQTPEGRLRATLALVPDLKELSS